MPVALIVIVDNLDSHRDGYVIAQIFSPVVKVRGQEIVTDLGEVLHQIISESARHIGEQGVIDF